MKVLLLMILLACAACSSSEITVQTVSTPVVESNETIPTSVVNLPSGSELQATVVVQFEIPVWQTLPLLNARTGETFTFADFAGRVVFVEPMATWCTNCRQQLENVSAARASLDPDENVFIALSVETNISSSDLANYADSREFDWLFAVMSPEMLTALVAEFGRTITNPPSTPHFIIRPDGSFGSLITGIESSEQLVEQLNAART